MPSPSGVDESDGGLELRAEEYGSTHFGGYAVGTSGRGASKPYGAAEVGFCPGRSNVANLADWIVAQLGLKPGDAWLELGPGLGAQIDFDLIKRKTVAVLT
jgi:hypothetical protein